MCTSTRRAHEGCLGTGTTRVVIFKPNRGSVDLCLLVQGILKDEQLMDLKFKWVQQLSVQTYLKFLL